MRMTRKEKRITPIPQLQEPGSCSIRVIRSVLRVIRRPMVAVALLSPDRYEKPLDVIDASSRMQRQCPVGSVVDRASHGATVERRMPRGTPRAAPSGPNRNRGPWTKDRDRRRSHRRCHVRRRGVVAHEQHARGNQLRHASNERRTPALTTRSGWHRRGSRVRLLPDRLSTIITTRSGSRHALQLRVEWPALGRPHAPRRQRDEGTRQSCSRTARSPRSSRRRGKTRPAVVRDGLGAAFIRKGEEPQARRVMVILDVGPRASCT